MNGKIMLFPFEQKIKSYIENQNLLLPQDAVLVAVSGGPDSMCLLYILNRLGYNVSAGHVNYQLRGEDSILDEQLVIDFCKNHNIKIYITRVETNIISQQLKQGIQEVTRQLRYDWFNKLCTEHGIAYVATGHHIEDQAETVLFNLIRGTGIKGVAGIHPIRNLEHNVAQIKIIRPFLSASKAEITDYVNTLTIPYRLDISNLKDTYTRNKIRHHILPLLNTFQSNATEHISEFATHMQALLPFYNQWLNGLKAEYTLRQSGFIQIKLDHSLPVSLIYLLLEDYGFNSSQADQIHQALEENHSGKLFYSELYTLILGNTISDLILTFTSSVVEERIEALPYHLNHFGYDLTLNQSGDSKNTVADSVVLNLDNIKWPLILRTWQPGDKMAPMGMKGKQKKIQDILTDKKVYGVLKKNALVLLSNEKIIWLWPCNIISEPVKADGSIKNSIKITAVKKI
ncbi:MAG: tRNA lysidine(34) synthetase TilS [Saprospiraceae bacterium]